VMDKQTLSQKLAALSSEGENFENGLRVVSDGVTPPILTAILSEIDMTVLPRKLTFRMNDSEISLVAGGRRLRGLVKASKDIKGVMGVLGKSVSHDEPEVIAGLFEIIGQFTATAGQMTVVSDDPDAMGGQSDAGLSGQSLADHWDVDLHPQPPTPMIAFARACGDLVTAWVVLTNNSDNKTGGDGATLAVLKAAIAEQWDDFSGSVDQLAGDSGFICLNDALGDAGSVAIVKGPSEAAILCYASQNMAQLHGLWNKSVL
jgi:hypothetical protein